MGGEWCIRGKEEKSSRKRTRDLFKNPNRTVDDNIKTNIKETEWKREVVIRMA